MKFINKPRQTGKTTLLIHTAYVANVPIVTTNVLKKQYIINLSKKINCDNIKVYTVSEWKMLRLHENCLVDDAEILFKQLLNEYLSTNVIAATMTIDMK